MSNLTVVSSKALPHLFSKLRCKSSDTATFVYYANRLMRILAEEGIAALPSVEKDVETPCGIFKGVEIDERNCIAVSIIRAGDSLLDAVRFCLPSVQDVHNKSILLVDPMLASGGSAMCAIKCLIDAGVSEDKIIFLNVVSCPEGIKNLHGQYPKVHIVTAAVDEKLNGNKYIVPGLGDWGDRFYGTAE